MKKSLLLFAFFGLFFFTAKAQGTSQFEVSVNPVALLFGVGSGSIDYNINRSWSAGLDGFAAEGEGILYGNVRHYFRPLAGADRFNVGSFIALPFSDPKPGIGFFVGHKWVSESNITFEIAGGAGRQFSGEYFDFVPYFKLNLGYRFDMTSP